MATLSDANFTGLRASLGDWLHRSDLTNTDLGNFIYMFESEFNTEMRDRNMVGQTTIGVTSGYLLHPSDWQEWKAITAIQGQYRFVLQPYTQEQADQILGTSTIMEAMGYVVVNDRSVIYPTSGSGGYGYQTTYYKGVPALNVSNTTNWLLTKYPQAYLYGSLLQATAYIGDDPRVSLWKGAVSEALNKIQSASASSSNAGGVMQMRPDRYY